MQFSLFGQMTTTVLLTVYCFSLFLEFLVLKKLIIERGLERTAKPDRKQGGSEAAGSGAWRLLGTYSSTCAGAQTGEAPGPLLVCS